MLNSNNYLSVNASVSAHLSKYMPIMIQFKSTIQRDIIPQLSPLELQDIAFSRINKKVIEKLVNIGKSLYKQSTEHTDETIYCICLAIGTIIKEYEWGIRYIQQDGMCEIAAKIVA